MSIDHVQNDFQELKNKINHIDQIFEKVYYKTNKLKKTYSEFISRNKHLDSFGIDSLHFQSKLIECDNKHIENKYILICNKVYGEYYTLFKMISKFVNEHMDNKRIKDICNVAHKYPVYKKLEPYKKYTIDSIDDIHHVIIQTIIEMNNVLQIKENELKMDQQKSVKGLNIGNFVNRFKHENQYLDSQIKLYINYLDVFHDYHNKYLERVVGELKYLYSQMEQELTFDEDDDDEDVHVKQNDKTSYMNHVNTKSPQVNPNPNTNVNPTTVPMVNPIINNNKTKRQSVRSKKNNNEPQPIIQMNVKEM